MVYVKNGIIVRQLSGWTILCPSVFPLGMYTTCSFHLFKVTGLNFIFRIAYSFYFIAAIAWALTFFGMLNGLRKMFFPRG